MVGVVVMLIEGVDVSLEVAVVLLVPLAVRVLVTLPDTVCEEVCVSDADSVSVTDWLRVIVALGDCDWLCVSV